MVLWRKEHKVVVEEKALKGGVALPSSLAQELLGRPLPFGHKVAAIADGELAIFTTPDYHEIDLLALSPR
ncbi:hypothetical protein HRbin23_01444 [bacterium HR23]|nr:hypothetical protein HRbin23_01444 [bacterium HR23]